LSLAVELGSRLFDQLVQLFRGNVLASLPDAGWRFSQRTRRLALLHSLKQSKNPPD
jgi:hypothetical protein